MVAVHYTAITVTITATHHQVLIHVCERARTSKGIITCALIHVDILAEHLTLKNHHSRGIFSHMQKDTSANCITLISSSQSLSQGTICFFVRAGQHDRWCVSIAIYGHRTIKGSLGALDKDQTTWPLFQTRSRSMFLIKNSESKCWLSFRLSSFGTLHAFWQTRVYHVQMVCDDRDLRTSDNQRLLGCP